MGLFGDKTKTYYSSTSTVLFEDTPSIVNQTVASSVTQNRNIATDLITNLANGIYFNANQLYNYGKSGGYYWGLPNGYKVEVSQSMLGEIQAVIEYEESHAIYLYWVTIDSDPTTGHYIYKASYSLADVKGAPMGVLLAWTYDESLGTYPTLDLEKDDSATVSPYYPVIPLRVNNVYLGESTQPQSKDIHRACEFLHLNPDDINDAMEEQHADTGENPVEDAYIVIATEVTTNTQEGIEYLFRYFDYLRQLSTVTKVDLDYWKSNNVTGTPPINSVRIEDANYAMELGWLYITKTTQLGTLTDKYVSSHAVGGDFDIPNSELTYNEDTLILLKQTKPNEYEEIHVVGLVHSNWAIGHELRTTLNDAFNDPDLAHSFIIPLRKDVANAMGGTKLHDLMYSAIRLVLNDINEVKLKWYQTGFFKFFTLAVSICISVFYPPLGIAALSAAAVGIALVQVVAMKLLIPIAFRALEDLLGEELAILIAVLAVSYGATTSAASFLPSAGSVANQGIANISAGRYQEELAALQQEQEELQEDTESLEEQLLATDNAVRVASSTVRSDPYGILEADTYVRKFQLQAKEPTLIRSTTHSFTDISRYTDRPDSYIRLGHTGV